MTWIFWLKIKKHRPTFPACGTFQVFILDPVTQSTGNIAIIKILISDMHKYLSDHSDEDRFESEKMICKTPALVRSLHFQTCSLLSEQTPTQVTPLEEMYWAQRSFLHLFSHKPYNSPTPASRLWCAESMEFPLKRTFKTWWRRLLNRVFSQYRPLINFFLH